MPDRPIGASYARISGTHDERTASLESQEEANIAKLEAEGYLVPPEFRFREKFTGYESIYERSVLIRARELIAQGKIQALCCYDTDRLARDSNQLVGVVANTEKAGCKVYFAKTDHQSGRIGDLLLYLRGYASSVEYDQIRDRTMRGKAKILASGKLIRSSAIRYGFVFDAETRRRTLHPEHAEVVRRIFAEVASGISLRRVVEGLNRDGVPSPSASRGQAYKRAGSGSCWNFTTVRRMLGDEVYLGKTYVRRSLPREQWLALEDATEPLIEAELWDRAHAAMSSWGRPYARKGADRSTHLFRGHVWCGACGGRLAPSTRTKASRTTRRSFLIYRCNARYQPSRKAVACPGVSFAARRIDAEGWAAIQRILSDPVLIERKLESLNSRTVEDQIRRDLDSARQSERRALKRLANLTSALSEFELGKVARSAIFEKLREVERDQAAAESVIADLESRLSLFDRQAEVRSQVRARVDRIRAGLLDGAAFTIAEKREILTGLAVKLLVRKAAPLEIEIDLALPPAESGDAQAEPRSSSRFHVSTPHHLTLRFAITA